MMTIAESLSDLKNSVFEALNGATLLDPLKVIRELNDKDVGAVYVFSDLEGKIVYVGQTRRIVKRLKRHGGLIVGGNGWNRRLGIGLLHIET
jgi:hypothetical protein